MLFKDLIGQEKIQSQLRQSVRDGRLGQAMLFLGPEGSGNLSLALALSQYLVCENKGEDDSCGECNSCRKAEGMVHPDIHYTFPFVASGSSERPSVCADFIDEWRDMVLDDSYLNVLDWLSSQGDKNGNINHKECRSLIGRLALKAYEGGNKVWILWMAEFLGHSGNILLKLIEEPPEDTTIILVAHREGDILSTIKSRVQMHRLSRLQATDIQQALEDRYDEVDSEIAEEVAQRAEGNFHFARVLLYNETAENEALFSKWMRACSEFNLSGMNEISDALAKLKKEDKKGFLRYGLYLLQLAVKEKSTGVSAAWTKDNQSLGRELVSRLSIEDSIKLAEVFEKGHYYLLRNAYAPLLFFNISLQFSQYLRKRVTVGAQ